MNMILTTENLTKTYGSQKAVDKLSLAIPENTVYGLLILENNHQGGCVA